MTELDAIWAGALPHLPLLARMTAVAAFVVLVALIAERLGPFLGGMVASLPLYTGPVYVLLALEHDPAYLSAAAVASVAICGANPVYVLVYALLARRHNALVSVVGALAAWAGCAVIVRLGSWTLVPALLFVAPIYGVALALSKSFTRGIAIRTVPRQWTDLALRAMLVAALTGVVIVASGHVPPQVTGILSVMPILLSSLILVMHPRVGGRATAALMAHTLGGLVGMVLAFSLLSVMIERIGTWPALAMALAVTLGWNMGLIAIRRLLTGAHPEPDPSPPPPPSPPQRASSASMRPFM